jgi:hypothetical protein
MASQSYFNHPLYLSDPALPSGGNNLYPELPLIPGAWIARALNLGPVGIDYVWRFLAGLTVPLVWYLLIRSVAPRPWLAALLVIPLLADGGMLGGNLVLRQLVNTLRVLTDTADGLFQSKPFLHRQWRLATPALTMAYLAFYIWLLLQARKQPTPKRVAAAGLAFGTLFYVYPYYWTAVGLALVLGLVADAGYRRVHLAIGMIGGLAGLPRIVFDVMLKNSTSSDWLTRFNKFVPVPRFHDLLLPKIALIILALSLIWVWTRRRDLLPIWLLAFAGLALNNQHLATGLELENYHWMYVWGPCVSLLVLLAVASAVSRAGRWERLALVGLAALVLADAAMGLGLRAAEARRSPESIELTTGARQYQIQRLDSKTPPLAPNSLVAGDRLFLDMAGWLENQRPLDNYWVFLSPSVTNEELDLRVALNSYLLGTDRQTFMARLDQDLADEHTAHPWRDPSMAQRRRDERLAAYNAVTANPPAALNRLGVRYLALTPPQPGPPDLQASWTRLQDGPAWSIWERRPDADAVATTIGANPTKPFARDEVSSR